MRGGRKSTSSNGGTPEKAQLEPPSEEANTPRCGCATVARTVPSPAKTRSSAPSASTEWNRPKRVRS